MTDLDISKLDLTDPEVQKLLKVIAEDQDFNSALKDFCDTAYPWQQKALELTADHQLVGLVSGNRTGKSYTTCALAAMALTGKYPSWYKGKRFDGPITCMVSCVDSNSNKRVFQQYLLGTNNRRLRDKIGSGMIPKKDIEMQSIVSVRGDDVQSMNIKHVSGGYSTLYFGSYSQGREAIQGFSGELIVVDEQCPTPFLQEAITRTKTVGGVVVMSFTPLEGLDYTLEQLLELPAHDDSTEDQYGHKLKSDGKWAMVRASWEDAYHVLEQNPDAIEEAKREYGVDFACRVYGIPAAGSGNIFQTPPEKTTFDPATSVVNKEWKQLIGVDFGWSQNDPSAMVKMAWDEYNDVIYVLEEWKGHTITDREFVRQVNALEPLAPVAWPRDGNKASDWKGGGTVSDKLRDEHRLNMLRDPFKNPDGSNHINPGLQEINDRLASGRLKISGDCQELLAEMSFYHYGKDIAGNSTGKPDKNCHDHLIDALRYGVMSIIQGYGKVIRQRDFFSSHSRGWQRDDDDYLNTII